jgi:hypothetical protein
MWRPKTTEIKEATTKIKDKTPDV